MPTVQIVIEGDDSGASAALDDLNAKSQQVSSGFAAVGAASDEATGKITAGVTQSRIVTDLMTGNIMRAEQALVRLGATTELLGPIFAAAFVPGAVVAFGELLAHISDAIDKAIDKLTGWKAAAEAMNASQGALNKTLEETNKQIQAAQRSGATIGMGAQGAALTDLGFSQSDVAKQQALVDSLNQQLSKMRNATVTVPGGIGPSGEIISPQTVGQDLTDTKKWADLNAAYTEASDKLKLLQQDASNAAAKVAEIGSDNDVSQLLKYNAQMDELIKKNEQYATSVQKTLDLSKQMGSLSEEKNIPGGFPASLMGMPTPYGDESLNFVDTAAATSTQAFQTLDKQMMDNMEADNKVAQNAQEQSTKYAEAWTRARNTMASQLDSFFNELTSGNIAQTFLKQFEKLMSQVVATWMMGIQGMQQAVTRSGGLFGTLMGDFGGPSGGGGFFGGGAMPASGAIPGVDASFMNGSDMSSLLGGSTGPSASMALPMSAGGGGALGAILPAGARSGFAGMVGGSAGSGGLLSMLGSLLPIGALAGGSALMGMGGIAGMFGSAGVGYGAGALAGPLMQTLSESGYLSGALGLGTASVLSTIGQFLGPIGAGIGLIGGLIGLFTGNGKLKTEQANLQNQELIDLTNLENAFSLHQIDYNSAIAQCEQIRQSYTQQQEALQKGGSVGRVDSVVNDAEQNINNLEAQRENTLNAVGGYGPAQFERGGYVHPSMARLAPPGFAPAMHFATGGAVPAIVHAGEYVLNAGAVNRVGVRNLDAVNGGAGAPIHMENHFHALDAASFEQWMSSGDGSKAFSNSIRRAIREGRL